MDVASVYSETESRKWMQDRVIQWRIQILKLTEKASPRTERYEKWGSIARVNVPFSVLGYSSVGRRYAETVHGAEFSDD